MKLVNSVLLSLSYKVETTFDVSSFARKSAVSGNLDSCGIVDHEDCRNGR